MRNEMIPPAPTTPYAFVPATPRGSYDLGKLHGYTPVAPKTVRPGSMHKDGGK